MPDIDDAAIVDLEHLVMKQLGDPGGEQPPGSQKHRASFTSLWLVTHMGISQVATPRRDRGEHDVTLGKPGRDEIPLVVIAPRTMDHVTGEPEVPWVSHHNPTPFTSLSAMAYLHSTADHQTEDKPG